MAAPKCLAIIKLCRVRVSLLNEDGSPEGSYYVTDKTVTLGFTPEVITGADTQVLNGCGCLVATNKDPDLLKRFTFEMSDGVLEPGMLAMLLGQAPILDPVTPANVIGVNWTLDQLTCAGTASHVALEGWSQAYDVDHPDADYPWFHLRWPSTQWQLAANTLGADFLQPALTGFSRGNTEFGDPFNDLPNDGTLPIDSSFFSMWLEAADPPDAECLVQQIA